VPCRVTGPDRTLLLWRISTSCSLLRDTSTCSGVGSSTGCRWISVPPWTSIGCSSTIHITVVFTRGCRVTSAPGTGALPPLPSSLTSASAKLILSHILTPLSSSCCAVFLPFLKYVITEVLRPPLIGSASASVKPIFAQTGTGSITNGGTFWHLLTESTPAAPPLPKTLPCKTNRDAQPHTLHESVSHT